jgi:PHD/YefM family antitoxin component YafN of YafNO toxin-antitoxin module
MHTLREHDVKNRLARDRALVMSRQQAVEAHTTQIVQGARMLPDNFRKWKRTEKKTIRKRDMPGNSQKKLARARCFACGIEGHFARNCNASFAGRKIFENEHFVTRPQQKNAEAHAMDISHGSEGTSIMAEVNCAIVLNGKRDYETMMMEDTTYGRNGQVLESDMRVDESKRWV